MTNFKNTSTSVTISVIISVIVIVIFLQKFPSFYFAEDPSGQWWTALSIIVAICSVVIGLSLRNWFNERYFKEKITSLERSLDIYISDNKISYENVLSFISNILEVQNVSETHNRANWDIIKNYIETKEKCGVLKPQTLRAWSTLAWKQEHLDVALYMREAAYKLNKNDFMSRVMLCSILTQFENSYTRIENILNETNLKSDSITDEDKDHFYNIQGVFYKKNRKFKEASNCFNKSICYNVQTWSFNGYILTLLMREEISNDFITKEIDRIKSIPNSKWLDDTVLHQKAFRFFTYAFINKSEIDKFYNYMTPWEISKLVNVYNNDYVKMEFFNFYSQITKKYKDKELNILYLTFYKLIGVYDDQADIELRNQKMIDEINKKMIF